MLILLSLITFFLLFLFSINNSETSRILDLFQTANLIFRIIHQLIQTSQDQFRLLHLVCLYIKDSECLQAFCCINYLRKYIGMTNQLLDYRRKIWPYLNLTGFFLQQFYLHKTHYQLLYYCQQNAKIYVYLLHHHDMLILALRCRLQPQIHQFYLQRSNLQTNLKNRQNTSQLFLLKTTVCFLFDPVVFEIIQSRRHLAPYLYYIHYFCSRVNTQYPHRTNLLIHQIPWLLVYYVNQDIFLSLFTSFAMFSNSFSFFYIFFSKINLC